MIKHAFRKVKHAFGNFTTFDGAIVLTYHRISGKLPKSNLVVSPFEFKKQMAFLSFYSRQFEIVDCTRLISFLISSPIQEKKNKRQKTKVLLTFDDGYQDNYLNAFSVLKKNKFPAIIFLTTGYIKGDDPDFTSYKDTSAERDYLSTTEIKEMMNAGISFGAHTVSHPHLSQITLKEATQEIERSLQAVTNLTKNKNPPFCYPYGEYNQIIKEFVIKQKASCAFSVIPGINHRGQDLFEIRRIDVSGFDNLSSFKYKLTDKYYSL